MKTLKPTNTWILILCSILVVSSTSEHAPFHHDVIQHGDSAPLKKLQNTIVPYGLQMPDHVLSTQDLSCISADNNIFEIMNKARETCNGTDIRCTFYHFINHGYEKLGTLYIDKERFDDLLMKFDNWLLTAEYIEKRGDDKTNEDSSLETAVTGVNGGFSNKNSPISTEIKGVAAIQGHIDKLNLNINESDDDRVQSHHSTTPHEIHHKIHHGKDHNSVPASNIHGKKWKNETHIKLNPEYNTEHRYFEVYIPRDKVTGKPRTIYVEVDQDKNEFVLVDEEIDKKLKGNKPIRIELDELSGIADTAFNEVTKASDFKEHFHNHLDDDEKAIINDISKHSEVNVSEVHLGTIDVGEQTQNSLNPSVYHHNIYNTQAEELHIPDDMTGNIKEIINVNENLIVPNKYINQAQFNIESHIDNSTDVMQNDYFVLLESNNTETDTDTGTEIREPLDTVEYNDNNTYGLNYTDNSSLDYSDISYENDNDTSTNYYELSKEHENVTSDDSFVQLEEHNGTCHDTDFDDTHDFSSSNTLNLNEFNVQVENPVQENKLKSTPFNNAELKLISSANGIPDYTDSQLPENSFENRQGGYTDLHDFSLEPRMPLKPYASVPILGKDSAKIFKTDSYLTSPPAYASLDLHAGDSQNTPSNSVVENPSITSYISSLDSVCTPSAAPKISQYSPSSFPSPPVECIVRLNNKDSTYSPLNFGVSLLPSHSRIEELRLPCDLNPLSLYYVFTPQDSLPPLTVPSMEYIGSSQSSPDHTITVKDTTSIQSVPSFNYVIQEPSLISTPYELESTAPMSSKQVLLSKLGLPKTNADYESILTTNPSSVKLCSLNDAVSPPCPIQQILPCLQKNILSPIDSELTKKSPCETVFPCSANSNRNPYTTIPYFSNPYLKPPQFKPSYLEQLLQTPLQPASKLSTLDSVPISSDHSIPCLTGVGPQEKKAIQFLPFAPNSQFSPLKPMLVGPVFPPTLPCPNIWNNIPYLPYTDQNIRSNPPFDSNYLTPTTDHKPLPSKPVPLSVVEHPCSSNNILEIAPSSYKPFLPLHTSQVQKDLNPSLALARDLESLSLKYGIPLSKILNSIKTEISDSKTCLPIPEVPNSNLKYDSSITAQQSYLLSETNANVNDKNISGDEELLGSDLTNLTPLDSSLIGPHLKLENSLDAHNSQSYTILSETTGPATTSHLSAKTQQSKAIKDSSLIGPQLSTLSSSNILLSDENQNGNEFVLSESDLSNLMYLDASLIGPHLLIGSPPVVLDSHISQGDILTSQTEVLTTSSSHDDDESKLNQNQLTNLILDSSLTGSHFQSLCPFKPLISTEIQSSNKMVPLESDLTDLTPVDISQEDLTNERVQLTISAKPLLKNEIQTINEMIPLESDLTDLTPLDISQVDFVNEQSEILQHEKSTLTLSANPNLHKTAEYLPTTLVGGELLLKSDSSSFMPLDSSFIGPELKFESLPVITDTIEDNLITTLSQDNLQKTDIKHDELESIILPSSLLPTLLNKLVVKVNEDANISLLKETDFKKIKPVTPDLNLNVNTQNTKLNEKLSLDNYVEIPHANTSQQKETDFKIVEEIPDLHDSNRIPLLSKYSTITSPELSLVEYEPDLDSSLIGTSILHKIQIPQISSTSDSSVQLDNYLVGPSILNEIDSQSPVIETDQLESSIATIDQNIKPSETTTINSNIQFDSSLIGPTLHSKISSHGTSTVYDPIIQFDTSSVAPSIYEAGTETSSVSNAESHLDTSFITPTLYETLETSASSSALSQLDSSLLGTVLKPKMETQEVSCVFDSKSLDSTLVGSNLSTVPFSRDEVQMISNESQQRSELANLVPLDSPLIGPHADIAPGISETIDFLNSDFVERHLPKPNTASSIYRSDLQELPSKFKNSITKSQLSSSEFKPTCSDLQPLTWNNLPNTPLSLLNDTAFEISSIPLSHPEKELGHIVKGPCPDSNYYLSPQTFTKLLPYTQGVPQISITPYSPFLQMRPLVDRNWISQPLDIQNILQVSPGLRPAVGNASVMPLAPEDFKLLMDLASQSKTFPQLLMPNISPPMIAIPPSLEWTTLSNSLPLEKYVPSLPKKNFSILPSNLESSICNPEYTPINFDDIISLSDENSYKLLKDMSILPPSQSSVTPSIPVLQTGKIVSPSLSDTLPILDSDHIKSLRPVLPISISNAMVPSSIYTNPQIGSYNLQNIPYMIPTPNIPPRDLLPYSETPLDAQFSEIVDYVPKTETQPIESSKSSLESEWHEIRNTSELMEPFRNFTLDKKFLQQLLSKPSLESPIILPSSIIDSMLQLSIAPNKSKSLPCQSPPELFTPVSPALTTPLSNAYTSPVLPIYASPLSVFYAKPILAPSTRLPLNVANAASPLTSLLISPYTASSVIPDFSDPLRPFKLTPLSNYPIAPTEIYNRPIPLRIPYKPFQMYSSPYLPVYPSPLPVENSPYSPSFMSNLTPAETSSISPVFNKPITVPYFSPVPKPKSLTNFATPTYSGSLTPIAPIPMASSPTGVLPPSFISPDLSTYKYLPVAYGNTLTQPSSTLSPGYITLVSPASSTLPSYNTLPVSYANNPFLNANQMLLTSSNILPLQNYNENVPKWGAPLSSTQIKQMIPSKHKIGSNVYTTSLTEETPYEIIQENMYSCINDIDNKYYEDYNIKHPLQSLSYTVAPEDIMETERRPKEGVIKQEDFTPSAPITDLAFEPSLQSKLHRRPLLTPYTPLYGEPLLRPCPTPQLLPHPSLIEPLPQTILPLNHPVSLPASILSCPLLKPLTPLTPTVYLPLLQNPCIGTYLRPYKTLATDEMLSFSSPYYSTTSQDMLAPPTNPRGLRKILSPQLTSAFPQVKANAPYMPFSSPASSPTSAYNLDNYIELPLTYNKPKSKKQDTLVKPTTVPSYNQNTAPIISHMSPMEIPISFQHISPLITAESLKKPFISSLLPRQITLQETCPLNEAPLNYQPYTPLPTVPSNAAKTIFKSPLVTSLFTVVPSVNGKYTAAPSSSSPYLTQPVEIIDSFQTEPLLNIQYTNQLQPKLSPILAQYAFPSLTPSYTSLPLETVPNSGINEPRVPQYNLSIVPTYDAPIQTRFAGNPFLNQDFKPVTEVPSYPVLNNQISPLKLTPYESILLSNLRPLHISKEVLESSPIPSSTPLSLLKPLTKTLTQKSRQYQPKMIPINSQYVSQSQVGSIPQLLPCTSPILNSPLLKPLLTNLQSNSPSLSNYVPNSNIAVSESSSIKSLPFVSSNQKYSAPSELLVSELPETLELTRPVPTPPYSFLKPAFYKQYQSPVTMTNIPTYSNYDVLESSPYLPIKGNHMNTVKPIEVSPISAVESSRLPLDSLDAEIIEGLIPYELRPDLKDKFAQLPLNLNQQRHFSPALSYLALPQPTHTTSASAKYKTARPRPFSMLSLVPEDVELIDTTDFIPVSPIQSEALTSSYSPTDRKAPISTTPLNIPESNSLSSSTCNTILSNSDFSTTKQLPPKSLTNSQSIREPDISQFFPYSILSNSDFSSPTSNQLPPTIQKQLNNQRLQLSPIYLSPQECEELTKGLTSSPASSSSPIVLPYTNIDPQLITNLLTTRSIPLTPLYASPIPKTPKNLLQLPLFGKHSPLQETPIEITPEKENIQSLLNKYKTRNTLIKSKESCVEYIEDIKSNEENDYVTSENVSLEENIPEAKSFTKNLAEIKKGINIPNYYNGINAQRPQRFLKSDHFYENNHIDKSPLVFTTPTFNTSPIASFTGGDKSYTTISPEIYKDFTGKPITHIGFVPKLDSSSRLTEYYPEIANSVETVPFTSSDSQNSINSSLKSDSQMKTTNAIEVTDTFEIPSSSNNPFNNNNDIKYSGYKTYQIPSLKSPITTQNLGSPSQMYGPPLVPYSPLNPGPPPNVCQTPSPPELFEPTEMYEPITPQYQASQKITSPLQTKPGIDILKESPELNDYGTIEDEPVRLDDIKEDNKLKTSLTNYINKKNDIKNKFDNNNQELTIPIGNIAITKKEPYNVDTIETNNPSIALKVWKSNVKIAQAELKLKFKDLSVINFMPVVSNLNKYDMEEIRKIVKNYIDEKYGNHVEITEPYTVDNQYTVIKDFEPNDVSNKYNLLWPTNYV